MKNVTGHRGNLEVIKPIRTPKGQPQRYLVRVDGWTCRTKAGDTLASRIASDWAPCRVTAYIGTHHGVPTLAHVVYVGPALEA